MIFVLWIVSLVISWFNARTCGNVWDSSRARGGAAHFMTWMGAVMAASGFTWCYLLVVGLVGSALPMALFVDAEAGQPPVEGMLFSPESLRAFFDLGYLVIIFPILGSGLAITVETWRHFARTKDRGVGDYAITGWNTFAQVHNTYSAVQALPGVFENLGSFFGKGDKKAQTLVVIAVVVAALAGILTTYGIIQARRRAVVLEDYGRARSAA